MIPAKFVVLLAILISGGPVYWQWKQRVAPTNPIRPTLLYFPGADCYMGVSSFHAPRFSDQLQRIVNRLTTKTEDSLQRMTALTTRAQQVFFDSDSTEFLVDSGAFYHIWTNRRHFVVYRPYTEAEKEEETVLGISRTTASEGIGQVRLRLEDDIGEIHQFQLDNVRYLPSAPTDVFVPQVFAQQQASEGDPNARCVINSNSITLEWTGDEENVPATKYIPLSKSNVGLCRTASGHSKFSFFAQMFCPIALPAYISDTEDNDGDDKESETGQDDMSIKHTERTAPLTSDFKTHPNVIPQEAEAPLYPANQ